MNLFDMLAGIGGQSQPDPTVPASSTGLPPTSPVDDKMVLPVMLLRAAAEVSQRRRPGQSGTNQNINAVLQALSAGSQMKADIADQNLKSQKARREDVLAQKHIETADENLAGARQSRQQAAETFPMTIEGKRIQLDTARMENAIKRKEDMLFEEKSRAEIAARNAQSERDRAAAEASKKNIEAKLTQLDIMRQRLGLDQSKADFAMTKREEELNRKANSLIKYTQPDPEKGVGATLSWNENGKNYFRQEGLDPLTALERAQMEARRRKQITGQDVPPQAIEERARELQKGATYEVSGGRMVPVPDGRTPQMQTPPGVPQPGGVSTAGRPTDSGVPADMPPNKLAAFKANPGKMNTWNGVDYTWNPERNELVVVGPASATGKSKTSTPNKTSELSAQFNKETREIETGKRSDYSTEVKRWLADNQRKRQAEEQEFLTREQKRQLSGPQLMNREER
jgi:hypothetical protein